MITVIVITVIAVLYYENNCNTRHCFLDNNRSNCKIIFYTRTIAVFIKISGILAVELVVNFFLEMKNFKIFKMVKAKFFFFEALLLLALFLCWKFTSRGYCCFVRC